MKLLIKYTLFGLKYQESQYILHSLGEIINNKLIFG